MAKRVLVLMGGWSAERNVSLASGSAVTFALKKLGYEVLTIDVQRDIVTLLTFLRQKPDVVFNALHGQFGEDGCIQGILNIFGIPYTHSGVVASAIAMNKVIAKRLFVEAGIPVATGKIVQQADFLRGDPLPRPYVVKPLNEGSSIGVKLIHNEEDTTVFSSGSWPYNHEHVLVESFIPGHELTVGVMGSQPLAATEILTDHSFYDYEAKYVAGSSTHLLPTSLPNAVNSTALHLALLAHQSLGCRGVSRVDFRYDGKGLFVLEVNTQPGLTPTSLIPEQAAYTGVNFTDLVQWMVENAACDV